MRADGWFGKHKRDVGVVWQQLAAHGALRAAGGGVQGLGGPIGRESLGFNSNWHLCARAQVLNVGAVKDADQAGVGVLHCSIGERGGAANGERGRRGTARLPKNALPALSASHRTRNSDKWQRRGSLQWLWQQRAALTLVGVLRDDGALGLVLQRWRGEVQEAGLDPQARKWVRARRAICCWEMPAATTCSTNVQRFRASHLPGLTLTLKPLPSCRSRQGGRRG